MKKTVFTFCLVLLMAVASASAQVAAPAGAPDPDPSRNNPGAAAPVSNADFAADSAALQQLLQQLQQVSLSMAGNLGKLRVDKWKTDRQIKEQAQSNIASIQKNLSSALPELTGAVRNAPQSLAPNFKLYRNLTAVFDVVASVTESAGAFGPKDQYEPLANDVGALEGVRRSMADRLDWLAGIRDNEVINLRRALAAAQAAAAQKKVTADEQTSPAKPKSKKTKTNTATKPKS